ncbi:hypothetical protein, partial [Microcoleus sp. herbarium5]|uniref:hypothetical protein n=1 Tax=Microcoleus sp. herbarium5 TaxID=3055434 RepID=UPI00403F5EAB
LLPSSFFLLPSSFFLLPSLVFVFFKRISQFLSGRAESRVDRETGDGHQTHTERNAENCCGFHIFDRL